LTQNKITCIEHGQACKMAASFSNWELWSEKVRFYIELAKVPILCVGVV
jgi:hypothetical protein